MSVVTANNDTQARAREHRVSEAASQSRAARKLREEDPSRPCQASSRAEANRS
jgi:hypothetical protein